MVRTPSTMLELGTRAPEFDLPDPVTGERVRLSDFSGNPMLVVFSCNHCPYVIHILKSFTDFANRERQNGLSVVMINSNDVASYPDDSPDKMVKLVKEYGIEFPYLYDESQAVALAYRAACTPDFFLFNRHHELVYRGQYDSSRPSNQEPIDGSDLKIAVTAVLSGDALTQDQVPSMGCNIKWKAGNEPDYF